MLHGTCEVTFGKTHLSHAADREIGLRRVVFEAQFQKAVVLFDLQSS